MDIRSDASYLDGGLSHDDITFGNYNCKCGDKWQMAMQMWSDHVIQKCAEREVKLYTFIQFGPFFVNK